MLLFSVDYGKEEVSFLGQSCLDEPLVSSAVMVEEMHLRIVLIPDHVLLLCQKLCINHCGIPKSNSISYNLCYVRLPLPSLQECINFRASFGNKTM